MVKRPTTEDLKSIAAFFKIIKSYLKMKRIQAKNSSGITK